MKMQAEYGQRMQQKKEEEHMKSVTQEISKGVLLQSYLKESRSTRALSGVQPEAKNFDFKAQKKMIRSLIRSNRSQSAGKQPSYMLSKKQQQPEAPSPNLSITDQVRILKSQVLVVKQSIRSFKQMNQLQQKQNMFKIKKLQESIEVKKELLLLQERKCQEMQEIALEICKMQKEIMTIEMQRVEASSE